MDNTIATSLARMLAVDDLSARVMRALSEAGVDSILLKGPTLTDWLYPDALREYGDCDLLVSPAAHGRAEARLRELGFTRFRAPPVRAGLGDAPSDTWVRGWEQVDLHRSFWGLASPPERVWALLRARTRMQAVAGAEVLALDEPAALVLIVLHALHHGREAKPLEDLRRAVARAQVGAWEDAAALAGELGCVPAFAAVLPRAPGGEDLRRHLGLPRPGGLPALVSAAGLPLSEGFERMARAATVRDRARVLLAEAVPSATFMRWRYPAARGSLGLVAAHARRWLAFLATAGRLARAAPALRRRAAG